MCRESMTLFDKNYSQMDPNSLSSAIVTANGGTPPDSWKLPMYYLVDVNAGYRFVF